MFSYLSDSEIITQTCVIIIAVESHNLWCPLYSPK
jgi:hypothetical protein